MAETLTDTSVAEIEACLDHQRDLEQPAQRTSVATHMAWIPDEWSQAAAHVMRGLGDRLPSRTLLLHPEPDAKTDGFDALITVDRFSGEGSCVSAEVVRIRLRGSAARAPASVVVPLQLPDLPVFLRWRGMPSFGRKYCEDLIRVADRLIVDSTEWNRLPSGLAKVAELFDHIVVSDLAWSRTLPWRASIASLWPGIKGAKTLRVVGPRSEALLMRAWLESRLRRRFRLVHEEGRRISCVEVDGESLASVRGLPSTPADLLSAELESFARDRVYEAAVRAV